MKSFKPVFIVTALAIVVGAGVLASKLRPTGPAATLSSAPKEPPPRFVGRAACAECHQIEHAQWTGTHHDLAMQEATPATVLGNFADASFTYHDVTSTFTRNGDEFRVRTDGPDGKLQDYKIAFTFGIYPLQQYLIEFPGGRYQALNICWDTRPADQGGQRWFHLYPNENVTSQDILHWTGPYQNWNHMCAECHSTAVHKNYDAAKDVYTTSRTEIDVSCEACHGPGSAHIAWAKRSAELVRRYPDPPGSTKGLVALLREDKRAAWIPDPATGIPKRDFPRTSHTEVETCARCHSRRGTFNEDVTIGRPPADTHRLALLEATLYEDDGQIKDEVFEYNSFLQSRMHAAGVTCTDCHNAHSLETLPGNLTCNRCHTPEKFDTPEHHFHAAGTKGSACVDCHMPTRNYMVVHARHDHSIRVPRPDLTVSIGTPNACNGCHADRSPQWAADEIARRTPGKSRRPHFGEALAAARRGFPEADALLAKLLADTTQPAIARATAAELFSPAADQRPLVAALSDSEPLIRAAAVNAVNARDTTELIDRLAPLLTDPVRQVRIDAARRLAAAPDTKFTAGQLAARQAAMAEYLSAQQLDADRAEARLNLGSLRTEQGDSAGAEQEYLAAVRLSPRFGPAYVNLADLYRQLGREQDAERVLRDGLAKATDSADIPHSLGLALVRAGKLDDALPLLQQATERAPDVTRYAYVYAVALETAGPAGRGIDVLKKAHERRPNDVDVLSGLIAYCRTAGQLDEAANYAQLLAKIRPNDSDIRGLIDELNSERARSANP